MKLSEQKRQAILTAADHLFFEQGVEQTSMEQVAKVANVSKRTLYNHFDTKDALFHAILLHLKDQIKSGAPVIYDESQPVDAQLRHIAQQESALLTSDKFLRVARVAFMHMLQDPDLARQLSASKVGCLTYLEPFLTQACAAGALVIDDIPFAAKQFVYQLKSFVFYPNLYGFDIPDAAQTTRIIDESVELFLARYQAKAH